MTFPRLRRGFDSLHPQHAVLRLPPPAGSGFPVRQCGRRGGRPSRCFASQRVLRIDYLLEVYRLDVRCWGAGIGTMPLQCVHLPACGAIVATGFTPGRIARTDRTQGHNRGINPLATWKCGRRGGRPSQGRRMCGRGAAALYQIRYAAVFKKLALMSNFSIRNIKFINCSQFTS